MSEFRKFYREWLAAMDDQEPPPQVHPQAFSEITSNESGICQWTNGPERCAEPATGIYCQEHTDKVISEAVREAMQHDRRAP